MSGTSSGPRRLEPALARALARHGQTSFSPIRGRRVALASDAQLRVALRSFGEASGLSEAHDLQKLGKSIMQAKGRSSGPYNIDDCVQVLANMGVASSVDPGALDYIDNAVHEHLDKQGGQAAGGRDSERQTKTERTLTQRQPTSGLPHLVPRTVAHGTAGCPGRRR